MTLALLGEKRSCRAELLKVGSGTTVTAPPGCLLHVRILGAPPQTNPPDSLGAGPRYLCFNKLSGDSSTH